MIMHKKIGEGMRVMAVVEVASMDRIPVISSFCFVGGYGGGVLLSLQYPLYGCSDHAPDEWRLYGPSLMG